MYILLKEIDATKREKTLLGPFSTLDELKSYTDDNQNLTILEIDNTKISFQKASQSIQKETDLMISSFWISFFSISANLLLTSIFYYNQKLTTHPLAYFIIWVAIGVVCLILLLYKKIMPANEKRNKGLWPIIYILLCVLLSPIVIPLYHISGWLEDENL